MRITIRPSALAHGITETEIRAIIEYPEYRARVAARRPDANLTVTVGAYDINEPYIEIIYDTQPGEYVVFHAMMLRSSTIAATQLDGHINPGRITKRQRPQQGGPKK